MVDKCSIHFCNLAVRQLDMWFEKLKIYIPFDVTIPFSGIYYFREIDMYIKDNVKGFLSVHYLG